MRNYFLHMSFEEMVHDLYPREDRRAKEILLIASMIVAPNTFVSISIVNLQDYP